MYNRYIPNGTAYTRIPVEEPERREANQNPQQNKQQTQETRSSSGSRFSLPPLFSGEGGLTGLLQALKLESLDSGDILLLLIVLLLLLEGDNLELVIALGLVLILGLGDEGEKSTE